MIQEVIMYGATCDNCGEAWYNDHYGWSAMNDELGLKEMISNDEWHADGDKHYEHQILENCSHYIDIHNFDL